MKKILFILFIGFWLDARATIVHNPIFDVYPTVASTCSFGLYAEHENKEHSSTLFSLNVAWIVPFDDWWYYHSVRIRSTIERKVYIDDLYSKNLSVSSLLSFSMVKEDLSNWGWDLSSSYISLEPEFRLNYNFTPASKIKIEPCVGVLFPIGYDFYREDLFYIPFPRLQFQMNIGYRIFDPVD